MAILIENGDSDLLGKLKHQAGELASVYKMEKLVTSGLDLKHTLNLLTEMATRLVGDSDICTLRLLNEDRNELVLTSVARLGFEDVLNDKMRVENTMVGRVFKTKSPYNLGEVAEYDTYRFPRFVKERGLHSFLSVPLILNEECLGALTVYAKRRYNFSLTDEKLLYLLADQVAISLERADLSKKTKKDCLEMKKLLSRIVEEKDGFALGHSERVTKYALAIAQELGIKGEGRGLVREAGILHDIGKIVVDSAILNKPGKLNKEEWAEVKRHPVVGSEILGRIEFLKELASIVRHHHERFEGGGYPDGLKDGDIPFEARILAVADSYEAMTSDRPYRNALPKEEARLELKRCSGTQFDPRIVNAFLKFLEKT